MIKAQLLPIESEKPLPFAMSKRLLSFVLKAKDKILNDDRLVIGIIYGDVGSGKSVRAHEITYIVSGDKVTLDKIAFNKDEFVKAILMARQEAIIGDEGISIFFSRGAMTKEGRLMAELMGQCRQKNLMILVCIPDILSVDSMVLGMSNFVCHVWESRKEINGRRVTIKGNLALYPHFRNNSFRDRLLAYLRIKKSNPLAKIKKPSPYILEAGQPYGEGFKGAFYCVDEKAYKEKKESILNKYKRSLERKPRNNNIDYRNMDKLIKAGISNIRIAELLNVSKKVIENRKATYHKKRISKPVHRRKNKRN
jgi:ABC-type dipeptide/oligopeptide/nickel transport system ATPase component